MGLPFVLGRTAPASYAVIKPEPEQWGNGVQPLFSAGAA
jgi:hypothetical protein